MRKKLLSIVTISILMLVAISFATAIDSSESNDIDRKTSPLFKIKIKKVIGDKIGLIIDNIKTKFLGERIFFLPSYSYNVGHHYLVNQMKSKEYTEWGYKTCTYPNTCAFPYTYCWEC